MASSSFGMRFKSTTAGFFDRKKVMDKVGQATGRVLSRFGSFVRRTAKSSIRKRKRSATPGQPPSSHLGTLKKLIFFAFDFRRQGTVIGPAKARGGDALTIEEGGIVRRVNRRTGRSETRRHHKFPYMKPALDKELPGLPAMWRNAVKA